MSIWNGDSTIVLVLLQQSTSKDRSTPKTVDGSLVAICTFKGGPVLSRVRFSKRVRPIRGRPVRALPAKFCEDLVLKH